MTRPEPTYQLLLDSVEQQLRYGQLRVGDRLPGERSLAETYGISRASVREALRVLSAVGLIRSRSGSGPASGAVVVSEPSDALSWALRMHISTRQLPVADIVETRLLLEGTAAAQAAQTVARLTAQGTEAGDSQGPSQQEVAQKLEQARTYLDQMDQPQLADSDFHLCDTRFHSQISTLAGNMVLDTVIDSLHLATVSYVQEAVPFLADWQQAKQTLQDQHRAIYRAVAQGRPEQAQQAVQEHIRWFYALSHTK